MRHVALAIVIALGIFRAAPVFADPSTYILHTPGVV